MLILIKYMILRKVITSHKQLHEMKSCVKLRALESYTELSVEPNNRVSPCKVWTYDMYLVV